MPVIYYLFLSSYRKIKNNIIIDADKVAKEADISDSLSTIKCSGCMQVIPLSNHLSSPTSVKGFHSGQSQLCIL
jgi:hypothetical protein